MTDTLNASQKSVLAEIDRQQKENIADAKWNFGVGAGMLATSLAVTALFPPAGFVASFTQIYSFLKGWDLLENFGKEKSLSRAKAEITADASGAATRSRAAGLGKAASTVFKVTLGVIGLGIAAAVGGWLLPAIIPAAIAAPVFSTAMFAGLFAVTASSLLTGASKGANSAVAAADTAAADDRPAPSVTDLSPSPLANAPTIAPGFGLAANNNAPEAKAAPELKPALKLDAPKP